MSQPVKSKRFLRSFFTFDLDLNVSLSFASGNIKVLRETNLFVSLGAVIKCLVFFSHTKFKALKQQFDNEKLV